MLFEACGRSNQTIGYMIQIYRTDFQIFILKDEIEKYHIGYEMSNELLETTCTLTMSEKLDVLRLCTV